MDKSQSPHAVYWMYNRQMELLYIGLTSSSLAHLIRHLTVDVERNRRMWATDIAAVKVKWYSNRAEARKAEAVAIMEHQPLHNNYRWGIPNKPRAPKPFVAKPCPRCGSLKQKPGSSYCADCTKAYLRNRRLFIRAGTWHDQ